MDFAAISRWARIQIRSPLFWILCGAAALRVVGLTWGLPASDGWDSDGIAPRDFLVGVVKTYQPGQFFSYPPLHLLLLTLITFPGWIVGLFKAHSLAPPDVVAELIKVPYMTFFAVVARAVSAAMSVGTIAWVGKIGEELGGKRVGACAAVACALNATLVYYGNVSNLDGPCMFWSTLAAWQWIRAIARHEPRRFRWAGLFTVAAIATKDQAYAVFLLGLPMVFAMWFATDPWPRRNWRLVIGRLGIAIAIASIVLLAVDGAITNPHGFGDRVLYLLGPASQNHAFYPHDWEGRLQLLADGFANFQHAYPQIAAYLGVFGLCVHAWRAREVRSVWAAGFFPLFAILSFTLTFNLVALRSEDRFVLAQTVFFSVYLGIAVDALAFHAFAALRWIARVAIVALAGLAFVQCAAVNAAFLYDSRYDAERWLYDHVRDGETIETYGQNVYLPRFPGSARVTRIAPTASANGGVLPNVTEIEQPYEALEARKPRFIVVSAFWAGRYLIPNGLHANDGHVYSPAQQAQMKETGARRYFHDLREGRLAYRLVHQSEYVPGMLPAVRFHQSIGQAIWIFERMEPGKSSDMKS
jgi:hypothetical protein